MRLFLMCLTFVSQTAFAGDAAFSNWRWGLGFGVQRSFNSVFDLELGSPALHSSDRGMGSLVLTAGLAETEITRPLSPDRYQVGNFKLMYESRSSLYKDLTSGYFRIGLGYSLMSEDLHNDKGMLIIPIQFGLDVVFENNQSSLQTFYVQMGLNSVMANDTDYATNFDGVQIQLGWRMVY